MKEPIDKAYYIGAKHITGEICVSAVRYTSA